MTEEFAIYPCPIGFLRIGYRNGTVTSIRCVTAPDCAHSPSPASDLAAGQILAYLRGERRGFDFPFAPSGTAFQLSVWKELSRIPYGEVRTYGQIASALGKPGAARAVGMACNRNPLWIVIPCHRVVGKDGSLTGYAGGLSIKEALLALEQT